jgi:hypothetical protein
MILNKLLVNYSIKPAANNVYSQLLVLCVLGKPYGFSASWFLI